MTTENRLTAEQLAALIPGDVVTIEVSGDFRRPHLCPGEVVRLDPRHIVVCQRTPRGVPYVHRFGRRDGIRDGGGRHAELVNADPDAHAPEQRRRTAAIDQAYRAWARNRSDLEALQALQDAIAEQLDGAAHA